MQAGRKGSSTSPAFGEEPQVSGRLPAATVWYMILVFSIWFVSYQKVLFMGSTPKLVFKNVQAVG